MAETQADNSAPTHENHMALEDEAANRLVCMGAEERWHKLGAMTPRAITKAAAGIERDLRNDPFGGSDPQSYVLNQAASQITDENQKRIHPARSALLKLKDGTIEDAPSVLKETPDRIPETMLDQNNRAETRPGFTSEAPWRLPSEMGTSLETEVSNRSKAADRRDQGEILPEDWKRWARMNDDNMAADMDDLELPGLDAAKNDTKHATPPVRQVLNKEIEKREDRGYYLAGEAIRKPESAKKWIPKLSSDYRELTRRGNEMLATDRSGAGVAVRGAGRPAGDEKPQKPTPADRTPSSARDH